MEAVTNYQRKVYEKLKDYIEELFFDYFEDDQSLCLYVRYGSTLIEVGVEYYSSEDVVVEMVAYCVQDIERKEPLLQRLLEINHLLPIGAFALVGNNLFFSYKMLGSSLSRNSFFMAIKEVANTADEYDNKIVEKFGGKTALAKFYPRKQRKNEIYKN